VERLDGGPNRIASGLLAYRGTDLLATFDGANALGSNRGRWLADVMLDGVGELLWGLDRGAQYGQVLGRETLRCPLDHLNICRAHRDHFRASR
jgi:hypothetical protein